MTDRRLAAFPDTMPTPPPVELDETSLYFGNRFHVMGVINVTPDSFSDGGDFFDPEVAVERGLELAEKGADILDIGGESTRPGADPVEASDEKRRVIPVIERLTDKVDIPVSIDTYKASVAERALEAGAQLINDVSGLRFDERMGSVAAEHGVPVVLMHMQGEPRNMQNDIEYDNVVEDIYGFFEERIDYAVSEGISPNQIILDPGIGFGKTVSQNYELIRRLGQFSSLERPLLLGVSRKSFLGAVTENPPKERLNETAAANACALYAGADIIRVHDVEPMRDVADIIEALIEHS